MRPSKFQHTRLETHRLQQVVSKKSHGVWLEACRHQLEDNLPPSDRHHTIDTGFETRSAVFTGSPLPFELLLPLLLPFPPFLCSCPCGLCLCCLSLCLHEVSYHRSAQPASLSGHRRQESQSRAKNNVLAALGSTCREPPCTPDRLRTGSCQHYTLPLRTSQECRSRTRHGGSSQTLLPGKFPSQLSHPALQLDTVATWRRIRPSRCSRSHLLPVSSLLPPRLSPVAALVASLGPRMIRRLVCVVVATCPISGSEKKAWRRSGVTVSVHIPRFVVKPDCQTRSRPDSQRANR